MSETIGIIRYIPVLIILLCAAVTVSIPCAAETSPAMKQTVNALPADPENEFYHIMNQRQELRAKEMELKLLEKENLKTISRLEQAEMRLQQELKQVNRISDARMKRLIRIYSAMDAKSAARLMEGIETDQAVEVLAGMKGDVSGAILANMDAKTASRLIRLLAVYKGPYGSVQ